MKAVYLTTEGDTTTELPLPLEVEGYGCGVVEINGKFNSLKENLYLCCDICEESFVGNNCLPILRALERRPNGLITNYIHHVIWLRVMRPHISSIRLYIANENGDIITLGKNKLNCTLLFIPPNNE